MNWEEFTMIDLETMTTPQTLERGIHYFEEGHLLQSYRVGPVLAGVLAGTAGNYHARLWVKDGSIRWECGCPVEGFCKHLAALAYGWIRKRDSFCDLTQELEGLVQTAEHGENSPASLLPDLFRTLVYQNPVNFWKILNRDSLQNSRVKFKDQRALLNLIRNLFSRPGLTLDQAEALREKMDRITGLLREGLENADLGAFEPFRAYLEGLADLHINSRIPGLENYLRELAPALWNLPARIDAESLRPLGELLFSYYFRTDLWEWQPILKEILIPFFRQDPNVYLESATQKLTGEPSLLDLITLYELGLATAIPETADLVANVTDKLKSQGSGALWLIDRRLDVDPNQAYMLAKSGLRLWPELKRSFRVRLITLHERRDEFRQAASLSFIQFTEEPSFEEYLRLKELLRSRPGDFREYLDRVHTFLETCDHPILLLRIMTAEQEYDALEELIRRLSPNPTLLLEAMALFDERTPPEAAGVFPILIRTFLADSPPRDWEPLLSLLAAYKKICLRDSREETWEVFRGELLAEHGANPFFMRKCGAVLGQLG